MKKLLIFFVLLTIAGCKTSPKIETLKGGVYKLDFSKSRIQSLQSTKMKLSLLPDCGLAGLDLCGRNGIFYSIGIDPESECLFVYLKESNKMYPYLEISYDGTNVYLRTSGKKQEEYSYWILDENGEM